MINLDKLARMNPRASLRTISRFIDPLNAAMAEFSINTSRREQPFLAQISHESAELTQLEENLNYSSQGLANTWPARFAERNLQGMHQRIDAKNYLPNDQAKQLHRLPELIANTVYAHRGGNGNVVSGDGWRYRGSGLIMLTFKNNQHEAATYFKIPMEDIGDWLRTPAGAARSAAWYWKTRGCNESADTGDFTALTKRINGGTIGLAARLVLLQRAQTVLV